MTELELRGLVKVYPFVETKGILFGRGRARRALEKQKSQPHVTNEGVLALRGLSLTVERGEFLVLLGPSGCGKTTLIRMIAGLEDVSLGEVLMDGRAINGTRPEDRDMAMIFQNYSLYPHLTVYENMAFPLKNLHIPRDELDRTVRDMARLLELDRLLERRPGELSGGQAQRVAIGRALVRRPRIFLMDEPFSNLDAPMRARLRDVLKRVHRALGTTFIYVTHDQQEAFALGTRVVLMREGLIEQEGPPQELYNRPASLYAAGFLGTPPLNVIENARLSHSPGGWTVTALGASVRLPEDRCAGLAPEDSGRTVTMGVRPVHLEEGPEGVPARLEYAEPLGRECVLHLSADGTELLSVRETPSGAPLPCLPGDTLLLELPPRRLFLFDPATGARMV